ncbi:MAG: hypothetical protein RBR71_12850 [Gudongella sp.]|nr:hypothetical protein [Gudongella sp.]
MMKNIINIILWIWSHSPILALSEDDNYATLDINRIKDANLRFSLLNIMLGDIVIYFITMNFKDKKLKLFYILKLEQITSFVLTEEKIDAIQERYRQHIEKTSQEDLAIEKESLIYHIQNQEQRINSSIEKMNIYTTIILTIIPLLLVFMDFNVILKLPIFLKIIVGIIVYGVLNICIYIFRAIKVKSISKSSFGDLRKSTDKEKKINLQYQYDWQQLKYKADLFVSFILNVQEWIILVLILSLATSFTISGLNLDNGNVEITTSTKVQTIYIDELDDDYSNSSLKWQSIALDRSKENCNKLLIIVEEKSKEISIVEGLDNYKNLEVIVIHDAELQDGIKKIIKENIK